LRWRTDSRARGRVAAACAAALVAGLGVPAAAHATASDSSSGHAQSTAEAPGGLRVDGQAATPSTPLVGEAQPTFAWTVNDSGRGQAQSAYELRLAPVGKPSAASYDSGRIGSSNSTQVAYTGPALVGDQTYSWSVRTWNSDGMVSNWSAPAKFDTGLFNASDWSAWWLQVGDGSLARTEFTLTKPVASAHLYIAAQGLIEPHLNGAIVDPNDVLDSSVTDYSTRVLYRDMDVAGLLHSGTNALGLMAGKGQHAGSPTVLAQLDVTYTDGTSARFGTDPTWKTSAGPVTVDDFYYGESYDARKAQTGWDSAGFDDSAWSAVRAVAPAAHAQSLAQGKPVTALDSTTCCGWSPAELTDGIDGSTDASEGYHSGSVTDPGTTKWVQADLGSDQQISQISLFPARPTNDTSGDVPGAGFPVRYQVQVSDDPSFANATTVADRTGTDQPNPGVTAVNLPADTTGRYVRVTATKLWCYTSGGCSFRLAELGVYGAAPATVDSGLTSLQADVTPPIAIVDKIAPVKETEPAPGERVYDFGQNYTGQVTLSASASAGTTANVEKGELLDSSGQVSTANISFSSSDPQRQTDHYTFAGTGTETYTPHFNYAGFRYAEVTGLPDGTDVTVTADVEHTDVATTGKFSTSDTLLNQIQGAVAQTQLNNLVSVPTDCPTREKHGWLGDAGDSDVEAMSNFDMQSTYDKWFGDIVTSQNSDGSVNSVAPVNGGTGWLPDPAWGTAYPQIIWDSYTQYGDAQPIADNYAHVKAWVDYLGTISNADHVVVNSPTSWGDDWLATVSTPHQFFQTGFYYLDATLLAKMARVMGNTADADRYSALATQVAAGLNAAYFDASDNQYSTGTQLSSAMPLVLGIVPAGHADQVLDRLLADISAHDNHFTTGFVGTTFVFQALGMYGHDDVALAAAERTDYPSFGYEVTQGPGTIWESWDNSTVANGTSSKDHIGLGGSIGQWFYQQLAGIQASDAGPGYAQLTLAPSVVGDLTTVSASEQTVRGTVKSAWQRHGSTLTYRVTIPVGATAKIALPLLGGKNSTVSESGRTIYAAGHAAQSDAGLSVGAGTDQSLALTAGSGTYTFVVTPPSAAFTSVAFTIGASNPIRAGASGQVPVMVEGHTTAAGATVALSVQAPSGWTGSAGPAQVELGSAQTLTQTSVQLAVPPGAPGGQYPVTLTATAPDGSVTHTTFNVLVFGAWASGTTATASSYHAPNQVNGATRTYNPSNAIDGDLSTFWNDDTADQYPDTLTITAPSATALTGVGFASVSDGVPVDFTVQTWSGSAWVTQASVTGNAQLYRWIPFSAPVTTTQVQVVVTNAAGYTRIAELTP
jgi:alpha-L-rhamnosidase